jgi:hypothetical protein
LCHCSVAERHGSVQGSQGHTRAKGRFDVIGTGGQEWPVVIEDAALPALFDALQARGMPWWARPCATARSWSPS